MAEANVTVPRLPAKIAAWGVVLGLIGVVWRMLELVYAAFGQTGIYALMAACMVTLATLGIAYVRGGGDD